MNLKQVAQQMADDLADREAAGIPPRVDVAIRTFAAFAQQVADTLDAAGLIPADKPAEPT